MTIEKVDTVLKETVELKHIARVEGHGSLYVETEGKELMGVRMAVDEGARLFEAFLIGREYTEVPEISCRICAICSASHRYVSTRAVEKAIGVEVSPQDLELRRLLVWGEYVESHILHALYLALPDYVGHESVISAFADFPDVVKIALQLKKMGNDIQILTGCREVHQVTPMIGGWSSYPTHGELDAMRQRIKDAYPDLLTCVDVWSGLEEIPFEREREFLAIRRDDEYAFVDGDLATLGGLRAPVEDYKQHITEDKSNYSYAKEVTYGGKDYMVGALARLNISKDLLSPTAKKVVDKLGITLPNFNTFLNNAAQLIETAQVFDMAVESSHVRGEVIEASEFQELASKYEVMGVPLNVINDTQRVEGRAPAQMIVDAIKGA